jgi:hypothetical protein
MAAKKHLLAGIVQPVRAYQTFISVMKVVFLFHHNNCCSRSVRVVRSPRKIRYDTPFDGFRLPSLSVPSQTEFYRIEFHLPPPADGEVNQRTVPVFVVSIPTISFNRFAPTRNAL